MLLPEHVPEQDRGWMDRRHCGLRGDIDVLSAADPIARRERDECAHRGVQPGPERRLREGRPHRGAARLAREPEAAARRAHLDIRRRPPSERPAHAVRRDGDQDRAPVRARDVLVLQSLVCDDDVGVRDDSPDADLLDVDDAFVRVHRERGRRPIANERGPRRLVIGPRPADDVGAQIREDATAESVRGAREIENAQTFEHHATASGRCAQGPPPRTTSSSPPCLSRSGPGRTIPTGRRGRSGTRAA